MANAAQISEAAAKETVTRSSTIIETVIPAGGTYGLSQYGDRFYIIESTGTIYVNTEVTAAKPYNQRQGEHFLAELRFHRAEFNNRNSYPVYLKVWAGFGAFLDSTFNIIESFTTGLAQAATSIAAAGVVVLNGVPTGLQLQRKSVIVSNPDSALDLQILDAADNLIATVFFRTSCTLPIASLVKIKNANGSAVTAAISEIWYTR